MIKVLEQAIAKVRKLPEDRQAYAAEVLEQIAAQEDPCVHRQAQPASGNRGSPRDTRHCPVA